MHERLRSWRAQLLRLPRSDGLMLALSAAVGLATGLLAVVLIAVVDVVQLLAWGTDTVSPLAIVLVPTLGGLAVGLLVTYVAPEASGGGVVQVMETIALRGGRFRERVPLAAIAATGTALGTGASGGREGPIVLIGGSTGSLVGRLFALDEEHKRTLVAAGAAAGIGASFNAPIGGMLFAIELIIGGFRTRSLQAVVVASVVGSVTARQLVGSEIIYEPALAYSWRTLSELALFAVLGVAAAGVGLGLLWGSEVVRRGFARLRLWPPLNVALGGLGVGLVALAVPSVLGSGDDLPPIDGLRNPIQSMIDGDVGRVGLTAAGFLALLAVAKLIATSLSTGSGSAVGFFAPALFCGAAVGGAVGFVADELLTAVPVQPGAFALVGMAATFTAAARAPLTAVLIVFEITNDYELVLPLMVAAGIALVIAERVQPESIYTLPLRRKGVVYAEPEDVDIMQTVRVGEIMTRDPQVVSPHLPLDRLQEALDLSRSHGLAVAEDGRLVGVVTISDLERAQASLAAVAVGDAEPTEVDGRRPRSLGDLTVGDVCTRSPLTVTPDDPVFRALRRMASIDVGRLPVVASDDHSRLVGMLRRVDLVKGYQRAITRSLGAQQRRQSSQLRDLVGASFVELRILEGAPAAGRAVRDVPWPRSTVLTAVRRGGDAIMPNGDTVLEVGDELVVLAGRESVDEVRRVVGGEEE